MNNQYYRVIPRYTAGSPASVPHKQAQEVARDEVLFYTHAIEGTWGTEWQARAEKEGLDGIVESHHVYAHHVDCFDLLTLRKTRSKDGHRTLIQEGRKTENVVKDYLQKMGLRA